MLYRFLFSSYAVNSQFHVDRMSLCINERPAKSFTTFYVYGNNPLVGLSVSILYLSVYSKYSNFLHIR